MKKYSIALALFAASVCSAAAQSPCPTIVTGAVLTAGQWNNCFSNKQDLLGYSPVNKNGDVMLGRFVTIASTISRAGFGISPGIAPLAPSDGDMWVTSAGLYVQVNGSTIGPILNVNQPITLSGAVFGTGATAITTTLANNIVTNAKLATMAANTIKGNATGGTAAPTDVAASTARSSALLNVDSFTGHGDSIYSILATDRTVGTNAAFTASRTWTLPAANAVNPGQEIIVADYQGTVTGTNTLVVSRAGSDTINGGTSITISVANGSYLLRSDGVSKWTAQALGSTSTAGVSTFGGVTGAIGLTPADLVMSGSNVQLSTARRTNPTSQTLTSGTTYTTPSNVLWIEVFACGGGGGGGAGGTGGLPGGGGGNGGTTSFNSITAIGGGGATGGGTAFGSPGAGGSGGTGSVIDRIGGSDGSYGFQYNGGIAIPGQGGSSYFGGGGGPNTAGKTNSCSGGGGGSSATTASLAGGGGGAGEFIHFIINAPTTTYTYAIGAAGIAGTATGAGNNGGAGGAGRITVIEHYGS